MHRLLIALATTALVAAGSVAEAAPLGLGAGLNAAADDVALGETVQYALEGEPSPYVWGGYPYCWYLDGWRGPGWYRCGFAWRNGFGWGGPMGWNNWHYAPRPFYGPGPRPFYGPGPGPRPFVGPGPGPRPYVGPTPGFRPGPTPGFRPGPGPGFRPGPGGGPGPGRPGGFPGPR